MQYSTTNRDRRCGGSVQAKLSVSVERRQCAGSPSRIVGCGMAFGRSTVAWLIAYNSLFCVDELTDQWHGGCDITHIVAHSGRGKHAEGGSSNGAKFSSWRQCPAMESLQVSRPPYLMAHSVVS